MKLISYRASCGWPATGVLLPGGKVLPIDSLIAAMPLPSSVLSLQQRAGVSPATGGMLRLLQAGEEGMHRLRAHLQSAPPPDESGLPDLRQLALLAPVPRPGKIIGIGRNYADHARETGVAPFEKPRILFKAPSSVVGPQASVPRPADVAKLDFEVELAVVIGSPARDVGREQALSHVAGYTLINDLSARELQFDLSPAQTSMAKSMDGFAPMGPWLVTADEIPDPQALELRTWLNGEPMQHGHTADMIFDVATLIAHLSRTMTLEPGDVIATGTPAGVGAFRDPPRYLQPGDALVFAISGVGELRHTIA